MTNTETRITKTQHINRLAKSQNRSNNTSEHVLKNNTPGGKLNPTFVEFLMGFPENWTKIDQTELKVSEMQSSHNVQES